MRSNVLVLHNTSLLTTTITASALQTTHNRARRRADHRGQYCSSCSTALAVASSCCSRQINNFGGCGCYVMCRVAYCICTSACNCALRGML